MTMDGVISILDRFVRSLDGNLGLLRFTEQIRHVTVREKGNVRKLPTTRDTAPPSNPTYDFFSLAALSSALASRSFDFAAST